MLFLISAMNLNSESGARLERDRTTNSMTNDSMGERGRGQPDKCTDIET